MQFSVNTNNGQKSITFVAQSDEDTLFILTLQEAFHKGSVEIIARKHIEGARCLDCDAIKKYQDCVIGKACFQRDYQERII